MKTVKFVNNGTNVNIMDYDDEQVTDKLKPAIYTVCQTMFGFHLSYVSDRFEVPDKIYGSTPKRVDKIMATYDDRKRSTGVLMSGDKGAGKTMLSSLLCNKMLDRGLPVILVERPFQGTGFIDFLNNIGECALFFDEFAKVFSREQVSEEGENDTQNGLLSVFDGAHTIKRLILLTENETYNINQYMLNRPGRIYYHFKYSKLEEDMVREYCEANKIPEDIIQAILLRIDSSTEFSFDALKAVVEEYTRFGEDITEIFNNLNIEEPRTYAPKMKVIKVVNTKTNERVETTQDEVESPSKGSVYLNYKDGKYGDGSDRYNTVYINVKDLVERNDNRQVYNLQEENLLVVLEKQKEISFPSYGKYLDV